MQQCQLQMLQFKKKKMYGLGNLKNSGKKNLIISNNDLNDMTKIVKALEDSDVLIKGISKTLNHKVKNQNGGMLSMILGTLGASLLGDILSKGLLGGKGMYRTGYGMYRTGLDKKNQ